MEVQTISDSPMGISDAAAGTSADILGSGTVLDDDTKERGDSISQSKLKYYLVRIIIHCYFST